MKFPGGFFQENNQLVNQYLVSIHLPHQGVGKRAHAGRALIPLTECRQHRRTVTKHQRTPIPQYFTKPGAENKLIINLAIIINFTVCHFISQKNPAIKAYGSP